MRDEIDVSLYGPADEHLVFLGESREVDVHVRHVDALVAADESFVHDLADEAALPFRLDSELYASVINEDLRSHGDIPGPSSRPADTGESCWLPAT